MSTVATPLIHRRCANHPAREAAALCPECGRSFCRECVTEHDERLICAACLRNLAAPSARQKVLFAGLARLSQLFLGLVICWIFFNLVGRSLLAIPSQFHDGTLWESHSQQQDEP